MNLIQKLSKWLRTDRAYADQYYEELNRECFVLHRPVCAIAMVAWLGFAFNTDPELHPEFEELIFLRLGLTVVALACFLATFSRKLRGKGMGIMQVLGIYLTASCAFLTGRLADDAVYMSGFQLVIMVVAVAPITLYFIAALYVMSAVIFVSALAIYAPELANKSVRYSLNNVALAYVMGFLFAYGIHWLRYRIIVEKQRSKQLLESTVPKRVADELSKKGHFSPQLVDRCCVLFTDFVNFSAYAREVTPNELVDDLDYFFTRFDEIIKRYGVEKIKTIGDSYMAAAGTLDEAGQSELRLALAGYEILLFCRDANAYRESVGKRPLYVRLGMHVGQAMGGVIGQERFTYDIWGETVNVAARMEAYGEKDTINVSAPIREKIEAYFDFEPRGAHEVKGVGRLDMHFVKRLKAEYANHQGYPIEGLLSKLVNGGT